MDCQQPLLTQNSLAGNHGSLLHLVGQKTPVYDQGTVFSVLPQPNQFPVKLKYRLGRLPLLPDIDFFMEP